MKRITSALLLASFVIVGGATAANAAPASHTTSSPVFSTDRVNNWPY